jgi:colicin import membrane protein
MARQAALEAFLQKLADEKAAAAASTAAYQASLAEQEVIGVILDEEEEVVVTVAAHEACKYALNLSESNIALFESALADGTLFNVGPQVASGTEFTANRWDEYAKCVSNYVNPF